MRECNEGVDGVLDLNLGSINTSIHGEERVKLQLSLDQFIGKQWKQLIYFHSNTVIIYKGDSE